MSDPANPLDWANKADEDLEMARSALRRKKPICFAAAFHAQQCAEKYLKGLLVANGAVPPKIHDLVALHTLCATYGLLVPVTTQELQEATAYAAVTRYPGEEPTVEEARAALETAKAVRRFARTLIPKP